IWALSDLATDLDERRILQIDPHPWNRGELWTQVLDYIIHAAPPLRERLHQNQDVAGIARRADIAFAQRRQDARNIWISPNDIDNLLFVPRHLLERDSLGRFCITDNAAGVVVRNEAFGNHVKKENRYGKENAADQNRKGAMLKHEL